MSSTWKISLVATTVVAVAAAFLYLRRGHKDNGPQYDTAKVERGRLVARVTATGTLSAIVTVQVGAQVSGRIQELFADFNSAVTKGQLIARIDPQLFDASVEQARANYVAAKGNLAQAKAKAVDADRQAKRSRALLDRKLVAQADTDTAEANALAADAAVEAAEGAVEQAKAQLHQSQVNLEYTRIISPINGTVISRNVDVGQTVASQLQAPTLFTIAEDLRKMQIDTNVAEADVGRLQDGMESTFTVDAYPNERFRGKVRQIRNSPQIMQNVVTYDAVIDVNNADLKLRPGMTANVTFIYGEKDDALKVPNAALRFRPPPEMMHLLSHSGGRGADGGMEVATAGVSGDRPQRGDGTGSHGGGHGPNASPNQRTVWIMRGGTPSPVKVTVGMSDGTMTELVDGTLQEGDVVVTDAFGGSGGPGGGARFGRFL
jgi:HlyD family secretion protein